MSPAFRDSQVPFTVLAPEDDAALAGLNIDAGWNDVAAVAAKNHVSEVALVQALYANGKMTVNIRGWARASNRPRPAWIFPCCRPWAPPIRRRRKPRCAPSKNMWKTRNVIDSSQRGKLTVDVRIANLAQWGEIQGALGQVSNVTGVTVTAMTMGYARINLAYMGGSTNCARRWAGRGFPSPIAADNGCSPAPVRKGRRWSVTCPTCCRHCACWRRHLPLG